MYATPLASMPIRILIVEDDPAGLLALTDAMRLKLGGATVEGVASAEAALQLIGSKDYDCVMCDVVMPGMDGMTFLTTIRQLRPEVAVILMTARDFHLKDQAIERGAYAFLTKPLDVDVVVRTVAPAARRTASLRDRADKSKGPH
jgi:DNA-binding NtrC family response regulator